MTAEVMSHEVWILAQSISATAFPSSDPHLCWKNCTLGSLHLQLQLTIVFQHRPLNARIWQSPERGELCGVGHACWHFRDLRAAKSS